MLAVLGPNGAGKSTLFGCLLGLTIPSSGTIQIGDAPLTDVDRQAFGHVAERVALYPHRTVLENVTWFAALRGCDHADASSQIRRVGLGNVADRSVRQLSKGMLQRVGLAIALCGQPELLVLDEPFSGLDPALLDRFQDILREEWSRGVAMLISTHTMSAVEPLATHVAILIGGRVVRSESLDRLRSDHADSESLEGIYHRIARAEIRMDSAEEVFV